MTRAYEFYETPAGVTRALLAHPLVDLRPGQRVLDPSAGEHAITTVLEEEVPGLITFSNDLDRRRPAGSHVDATILDHWQYMAGIAEGAQPDWVITNPPFSLAHKMIRPALAYAKRGVAFLLPLRFMEPARDRADVLASYPWSSQIVLGQPRPSYTEDGRTDSVTTFWAIWLQGQAPLSLFYALSPEARWQLPAGEDRDGGGVYLTGVA